MPLLFDVPSNKILSPRTMCEMSKLNVLIVGAGITGPATAYWLAKIPAISVTLIERSNDSGPTGHQIDLRGHGITLAKMMGIESKIKEIVVKEQGARLVNYKGKSVLEIKAEQAKEGSGNRQSISTEYEMMRGTFQNLLIQETEKKLKCKFNTFITSMQEDSNGIDVTFNNGIQERFDFVIGADGLGSGVRRYMNKDSKNEPYHSIGLFIAYFDIPKTEEDKNWFTFYLAPGRRLMTMRGSDPERHQVILTISTQNPESRRIANLIKEGASIMQMKEEWARLYKGSGWQSDRIASDLLAEDKVNNFYSHELAQVRMDKWHSDRCVLVGDSAWCLTPFAGIGTTIGFVGAYVLAGEIAKMVKSNDNSELSSAFKAYERIMRPYVTEAAKRASDFKSSPFPPQSRFGVMVFEAVARMIALTRLHRIFGSLTSDEIAWDLPEYPELK